MKKLNSSDSKLLSKIHCKQCIICGKRFGVKINKDGLIETDCFHGKLKKRYFWGWTYEFDIDKDPKDWNMIYKNKFYKIIGFSKITREIYYFIWKLIWGWQTWDYWECPKCANRPDDI